MTVLEWIGIIALVYLVLCLLIYLTQELFLFHPEKLPRDFQFQFEYPYREIFLPTTDGAEINGLHFILPQSEGVVFYFKGNTRSIKGWSKYARDFLSKGYDFFVIDYRGFGKSTGKRTQTNIQKDVQIAYVYLKNHYAEEQITIYGRSIGTCFATNVAASNYPKRLILDSPYFSMYHLARRFLPIFPVATLLKYPLRTYKYLPNVKCPIFIIHGEKDKLVPYRHTLLLNKLNQQSQIINIKKGGHNNLPEFSAYHHVLYDILHDKHNDTTFFDEIY